MALYIYKLSEKGIKKGVKEFNHAGKTFKVDKPEAFVMETQVEHPAPDFMGLKLVEIKG